jgi:hypothetical protein
MTTLTEAELQWLADHWLEENEFASNQALPNGLEEKLHMFFKRANGMQHYELNEAWYTIENRLAIAAVHWENDEKE